MKNWPSGYCREHFLADMMHDRGFHNAVELGVWKGRTFLHLLAHCPDATIVGVDTWVKYPERDGVPGGQTYNDWNMAGLEAHVRRCSSPFGKRAIIMKMPTESAARQFTDGQFDLVFVDADHSEAGVRADIRNWRSKVRAGGVLAGHDIDWPTVRKVVDEEVGKYEIGPDNVWWSQC